MKKTILLLSLSLFFSACSHTGVQTTDRRQPANKASERHCGFPSIHAYSATLNDDGNYSITFGLAIRASLGRSELKTFNASGGNVNAIFSILETANKIGKKVCVVSENDVAIQVIYEG